MKEEKNNIKTADNKVTLHDSDIIEVENNIASSREAIKNLNYIEDCFASLNKNLTRCLDLLGTAIKGKKANAIIESANETKIANIKYSMECLDSCKEREKKKLREYEDQKEELIKKAYREAKEKNQDTETNSVKL